MIEIAHAEHGVQQAAYALGNNKQHSCNMLRPVSYCSYQVLPLLVL